MRIISSCTIDRYNIEILYTSRSVQWSMSSSEHNYQAVGAFETTGFKEYRMEQGKKYRIFLTAVFGNYTEA